MSEKNQTSQKGRGGARKGAGRKPKPVKNSRPDVKVFIAEYKIDRNGRRAAIAAGYAPNSAAVTASRLLMRANVQAEIANHRAEFIAQVQVETGITLERTLREIARIGFFDPRKMFDAEGNPKRLVDLDDDTAAVIAGLDVVEEWAGSSADRVLVGHIKKWKLADKKGALDMLMKHLGGYEANNAQAGQAAATALAGLAVRFVESKG